METIQEMKKRLGTAESLSRFLFIQKITEDQPAEFRKLCHTVKRTKDGTEDRYFYNFPVAFDIETTGDKTSKSAFMYHWQINFNGWTTTGRKWNEFFSLLAEIKEIYKLSNMIRLYIWVHNLSFEASFLLPRLHITKLFATAEREPLYIETADGFIFRDSFILSGQSLEQTAKNLSIFELEKKVGDLDYNKPRNSYSQLTETEEGYCIADVTTLSAYIAEEIHAYKDITKIPLTNTGKVREYMRKHCLWKHNNSKGRDEPNREYREMIHNLRMRPEEYKDLRRAFAGGYTHAAHGKSGKTFSDVQSMDFSSSYPGRMAEMRYPMSSGVKRYYRTWDEYEADIKAGKLIVSLVQIDDLRDDRFPYEHYISRSKCLEASGVIEDNGRIVSADSIVIWLTNPDLCIIRKTYSGKMKILKSWIYDGGYLPNEYVKCVLHFYSEKTRLKDVKGEEANYKKFKGMNNGIYGMSVTDPVNDEHDYIDGEWSTAFADIDKSIERYNKKKNRFDFYPWGVFITAWARYDLWTMGIIPLGEDYIYSDTDSVKFIHPERHKEQFVKANSIIRERIEKQCRENGIEYFIPKTIEGIEKPLGEWDNDGRYKKFKTLGAKRYMMENTAGELEITIAGVNKEKGAEFFKEQRNPFREFKDGLIIPKQYSGKITAYYNDKPTAAMIIDERGNAEVMTEQSSVYLEEADYHMSLSELYLAYLEAGTIHGANIRKELGA